MKIKTLLHCLTLAASSSFTLAGARAATVTGRVFNDLNGNRTRDAMSEYGLPSWTLQLVRVNPPGPTVSTTTDVNGDYTFATLAAGAYTLSAIKPAPWIQTSPSGVGTISFTLSAGAVMTGNDFACRLPGHTPQVEWQKAFGGSRSDSGITRQTADGGYVIGATSSSFPSGVKTSPDYGAGDFWLVRLDQNGTPLWDRSYGGVGNDRLTGIEQTSDGGFVLCGITDSGISGNKTTPGYGADDFWIVRVDSIGQVVWELTWGGNSYDDAWGMKVTSDGGVLVGGESLSGAGTGTRTAPDIGRAFLLRLDANGKEVWQASYGAGTSYAGLYFAEELANGEFLVAGESDEGTGGNKSSPTHGGNDFWLVKIDGAGNVIWDRSFGGNGTEQVNGFAARPGGGGVLVGYTASGVSGNKAAPLRGQFDGWMVIVDANGNKISDHTYGDFAYDDIRAVQVLPDGRIAFAGMSTSGIGGNKLSPFHGPGPGRDAWVGLTDALGNLLWDQCLGGSGGDEFRSIAPTADGGLLLTGFANSNDGTVSTPHYGGAFPGDDVYVVKLAPLACDTSRTLSFVSAAADCVQHNITVTFSGPVDPISALLPGTYTLNGGAISVQSVTFGRSTLEVVLGVAGLSPGTIYTLTAPGLASDCGHPLPPGAQIAVACSAKIQGRIFSDQNNDCLADPAEFGLYQWPVKLEPGPRYVLADSDGYFSFIVPPGTYTLSAPADFASPWSLTCPTGPGTRQVSVANGQVVTGMDFGLMSKSQPPCADLWVDVNGFYPGPKAVHRVGANTPCCNANFFYQVTFGNNGTAPSTLLAQAAVSFHLPPNCTFVGANPPASALWTVVPPATPGDSVVVLFNTGQTVPVSPYQDWVDIEVHLQCDPTVSCEDPKQLLVADAVFTPFFPWEGECDLNDNLFGHFVSPCCSYDPNDCTVTPVGCGAEGLVKTDQALTYLVRFENIGAGEAQLVTVRNAVDEDLDLSTLEILGSSHPNLLEKEGRVLQWTFAEIGLASASVDELRSQGYVKFRIRPRADAEVGTVITNNAEIIFDANEPITTITTTNTLADAPMPEASFAAVARPGSGRLIYDFTATGGATGATHAWSFGPGATPSTSLDPNPAGIVFSSRGPHLVLHRTQLGDCAAEPAWQQVIVGAPELSIARTKTGVGLSWAGAGYRLEEADDLTAPVEWSPVTVAPSAVGHWYSVVLPTPNRPRFFRLVSAP